MSKKFYWLKLKEDFFKDKEMKKLRKIAGGDTYTIIYLKLMLLGLKDECKLIYEGIEDTFAEELALELDEEVENVKVTLMYMLKMGLLEEISDTEMFLTRLPECVGKETVKAELMRKKRARDNKGVTLPPPKTNAERQAAYKAKQACEQKQHVPFIEDYINKKRYNGNYYVVFKRDLCKCKICGSIESLCVHHIDGYDEDKPQNSDKNKMVTLCRVCHAQVHRSGLDISYDILVEIGYFYELSNDFNSEVGNESNSVTDVLPPVTFCYTEKEKEKEKELREKEKNSLSVASNEQSKPPSVHDLIFNHYISKGLIRHKALTAAMKAAINARLKDYSYEELVQAIDNYTVVYNSPEHFFKQKYGLADLMRDKDVRKFLNEAEPLQNFLINKRGARAGATYQQGYSNDGQPRNTSNFKSKFGVELDF